MFAISQDNARVSDDVIEGRILLYDVYVHVLIDSGSTLSIVATRLMNTLNLPVSTIGRFLELATPIGKCSVPHKVSRDCMVRVGEVELNISLTLFDIRDFDMSLGMDSLSAHHAHIDFYAKIVTLKIPGQLIVKFRGQKHRIPLNSLEFDPINRSEVKMFTMFGEETRELPALETIPIVS
ncbi:hypothetical protein BVC80_1301g3 [Macleaya cordata]|uniref:Aspartic peptidase domain n=1 Tax=Macleaya cordata TaxID=56857 RepID=A0A200R395_MACCD|nr:hypothetical protein BVC80_1301g3 [Macleaya cordata]